MKMILLVAAAMIAGPAIAQTTGSASETTATMTPPIPVKEREVTGMGAGGQMPATTQQAPMQNMSTPDGSTATTAEPMPAAPATPAGGYQPSTPMPMAQPGGPAPVFTPGPSVAQAFPAPAPLAEYPICKKGQYDKCMQRGGK